MLNPARKGATIISFFSVPLSRIIPLFISRIEFSCVAKMVPHSNFHAAVSVGVTGEVSIAESKASNSSILPTADFDVVIVLLNDVRSRL